MTDLAAFLSFRSRIVLVIGTVILLLMLSISVFILYSWRSMLIDDALKNSRDLAHAVSISVLDALIAAEYNEDLSNNSINTLISEFRENTPKMLSLGVLDRRDRIISHSDIILINKICEREEALKAGRNRAVLQTLQRNAQDQWVLDTYQPIALAGKRWGTLMLSLDAGDIAVQIRRVFFTLFSFTLIFSLITLSLIHNLIGRMTSSLVDLVENVDKVDIDTDEFANKTVSNDEIGILTGRFQALEKRLTHSRLQLMKAQKQVFQAEKLASIGRLASGVAHEINNPLNGIRSCIYSIQKNPKDSEKNRSYLELINEGITHIEFIVRKLLDFARPKSGRREPVDINAVLIKVLDLLDYRISQKNIILERTFLEDLPRPHSDEQSLMEVFMNIIINSMDAVAEGGKIHLRTEFPNPSYILVTVSDNGSGIPEELRSSVFDPFFTTKEPGAGTGLGLAVSRSIIEAGGGTISFDSFPDRGTVFFIRLPLEPKIS